MANDQAIPSMRPYARHLLICGHGDCGPAGAAPVLAAVVRAALGARNKLRNPERVKVSVVDCLGVCAGGPVAVVYPDGVWYHHLTEELALRITRDHLLASRPVEDAVFHRLYPADEPPPYAPAVRGDACGTAQGPADVPA